MWKDQHNQLTDYYFRIKMYFCLFPSPSLSVCSPLTLDKHFVRLTLLMHMQLTRPFHTHTHTHTFLSFFFFSHAHTQSLSLLRLFFSFSLYSLSLSKAQSLWSFFSFFLLYKCWFNQTFPLKKYSKRLPICKRQSLHTCIPFEISSIFCSFLN